MFSSDPRSDKKLAGSYLLNLFDPNVEQQVGSLDSDEYRALQLVWLESFFLFPASFEETNYCSLFHRLTLRAFFPTCQVRVVRFYVSLLLLDLLLFLFFLLLLLLRLLLRRRAVSSQAPSAMSSVSRQLRASAASVPCRTSTASIYALCSLLDLNRDHLRAVFPAGPQPRPSALSVPCQTSTATICTQCSLPDLNRDHLRSVFPAGPQPRPSALSIPCRTPTAK